MHFRGTHIFLLKNCSRSARRPARGPRSAYRLRSVGERGVTLLDTVVGVSLMLVVFLGIFATFRLTVDVVINNKARAGAITLADQRMEYIRSLSYTPVGTTGGVPAGSLAQSENLSLNGVSYVRRTVVVYADDPKDGTGAADTNGITADYKAVKVDVAWTTRLGGTRHVDLTTRVSPPTSAGETNPCSGSCGTLVINVVNSVSQPLAGASVTITNNSTNPTINFSTFTNAAGSVTLLAAPASASYSVSATNPNYTSDSASSLSVTTNNTTSRTLQIDAVSSITAITQLLGGSSVGNVPFTLRGTNTGYNSTLGGTGSPTTTVPNLKWDTYTFSVAASTGYDLAYTCQPQPIALLANTSTTTYLYLVPHVANSLAVKVTAASGGALLTGASVRLYKTGYDVTQTTDSCGQTYFGSLASGTYSITVSDTGYTTYSNAAVSISGQVSLSPAL